MPKLKEKPKPFLVPEYCKGCGRCVSVCVKGCISFAGEINPMTGLVPVVLDLDLDAAAEAHSLDMASTPCFQHASCDGSNWADRVRNYYSVPTSLGEIIAAGYTTPEAVVDGWMNSPGHRANILGDSFKVAGVALATGGTYGTYWTVDFGGALTPASVSPVPEPASYVLMGLGLAALGVVRRRR